MSFCLLSSVLCILSLIVRILGIDPGLGVTGYGVIEAGSGLRCRIVEAGVIRTERARGLPARLQRLYDQLGSVLEDHKPDVAVLEELYTSYEHPLTAIQMGHARGVICLAVALAGIPLVGYTAKRVRKAVTGNGNAGKEQVARMVAHWLGLTRIPKPSDVTDALAGAIGHALIAADVRVLT